MRKHLLGLKDMSCEEINSIIDKSFFFRQGLHQNKRLNLHPNKVLFTLFYENSTRTKLSFCNASNFLGLLTSDIAVSTSSVQKGENLTDTGRTLDALCADVIVMRNSISGAAAYLAKNVQAAVINGGDGMNEHPTQALLDIMTIREVFGDIKGLNVTIAGDIKHSRVARSNIYGLRTLGANVTIFAPGSLLPQGIEGMGVRVANDAESALQGANVIMPLRIQTERQERGLFPSISEFSALYGFNMTSLDRAAAGAIVLHPGPVNIGVEVDHALKYCDASYIDKQVTNGIAVRMAAIDMLLNS